MRFRGVWAVFAALAISTGAKEKGLPDILIIGAQKAGTKALQTILMQHPSVVHRPKEIHYFDFHHNEGVEWYKSQYPHHPEENAIRIDKSPYYLYHPLVPQRAYSLLPNAKIIALLRNPIDRAYSHYWMNIRNGIEPHPFEQAIKIEADRLQQDGDQIWTDSGSNQSLSNHRRYSYLARGLYAEQLTRWLHFYPKEQIFVVAMEEFSRNPRKVVDEIVSFLGLSPYEQFQFDVGTRNQYPPMDPDLRAQLSEFFRPHNQMLETLLQKTLGWD